VHSSGKSAAHYLPETTGAGCAFFDYDNDGWMDMCSWWQLSVGSRSTNSTGHRQADKVDWIEIKWPLPSGATQRFVDLPIDRRITIVEGQSEWK
jgi:hypothetical protein